LIDFQKHIHGDSQEIVPIFRVYTVLDKEKNDWKVVNNPNHTKIKTEIGSFIKQIIQVTSVVPRLEGVFRKDREVIVDEKKQIELSGSGVGQARPDINFQNMSEEEKQVYLNKKYYFPSASSHKESQYVESVAKSSEVNTISNFITD
jgi:hypothetical protein